MLEVLPVINCEERECVEEKIRAVSSLVLQWLHVDVSDGTFTPRVTWQANNPTEFFKLIRGEYSERIPNIEVHLMVSNPKMYAALWLAAGAKRIIVHIETTRAFDELETMAHSYNAELVIAACATTPTDELLSNVREDGKALVLAVTPGFSGGIFNKQAVDMVRLLRAKLPHGMIIVDGGINLETATMLREVGVSAVASSTYLFRGGSVQEAFDKLSLV